MVPDFDQDVGVGERRVHYGPLWDRRLQETAARGEGPVAVLVCHGMGQQVRYETISAVAESIRRGAEQEGGLVQPLDVRLCNFGDDFLARAELSWTDRNSVSHEAHVYEAYWAPLTEGKVTYRDTVLFLLQAAWNGFSYSRPLVRSKFRRWMFGGPKDLEVSRFSWLEILVFLLYLLSQLVIIAYVSYVLAKLPGLFQNASQPLVFIGRLLNAFLPGFLGMAYAAGIPQWASAAAGVLIALFIFADAIAVRYFLIEYVGDVAAYVSPYKDSKFEELRHQIQQVGLHVGKILYGFAAATTSPVPEYKRIVVVGHSLGSVLAYDTLNALINLDTAAAEGQRRDVTGKTRALITFGSPLDKTAFIFRTQAKNQQNWIREQLAASVQPLIVDYSYRKASFRWVNIWSPMDIISGALDYYDDPALQKDDPRRVQNKIDSQASTPLLAHVQYWNNRMLREELYAALVGGEQGPAQGATTSQN